MERMQQSNPKYRTIPFNEVVRWLNSYPYASKPRIILRWLIETGGRVSEMSHRSLDEIHNGVWHWKPNKGQSGVRQERLSDSFWREFHSYLQNSNHRRHDVFGITSSTFNRQLNDKRKFLGEKWREKIRLWGERGCIRERYKFQPSALRKNFATLVFYQQWKKYNDATIGATMVAKRMAHSTHNMTLTHYIYDLEELGLDQKYLDKSIWEILVAIDQNKLEDMGATAQIPNEYPKKQDGLLGL